MATPTSSSPLRLRPAGAAPTCMNCPARQMCLPAGMDDEACAGVDHLVERRQQLQRGDTLFQKNEPVRDRLYAIRSGTIKSFQLFSDGMQRIIGFAGSGDMLALETIGQVEHTGNATALSDCVVCELSHTRLAAAARQLPPLARQMETALGRELNRQQSTTLVLSYTRADQKLANFLLACGSANARRGTSPYALHLPMSRQDIGDYLGLTDATVSRLLRQLQRRGCLAVRQRNLDIIDPDLLHAIAAGQQTAPVPLPPSADTNGHSPRARTATA